VNTIAPIQNRPLVAAIRELKQKQTRTTEQTLISELKQARFLAPVEISPQPNEMGGGSVTFTKGTQIRFVLFSLEDGTSVLPAFTDWEEFYLWSTDTQAQAIVATLEDYSAMIVKNDEGAQGLVINPYGESLLLSRETLSQIEGNAIAYTVETDTEAFLGEPKKYPSAMVEAIAEHLKLQPSVKKAYLRLMVKEGEQSYLIVVDFENTAKEALFDGIASAALPHLYDIYLDMIPYSDGFGQRATEDCEPFYVRSTH